MKTNGITHQENIGYYMNTLIYDVEMSFREQSSEITQL